LSEIVGSKKSDFPIASAEPADGPLADQLTAFFEKHLRDSLLNRLRSKAVTAFPVNHFHDLFEDSQVAANELLIELNHSQWGRVRQTGQLLKFSATPHTIHSAAPLLGEHTADILREIGISEVRLAELRERGIVRINAGSDGDSR
jgi:crotonobetainyl-CoA:carnitine CoA-transferase CaiB-like acyl-CoA transferase